MKATELKLKSTGELQKDVIAMREKIREARFKLHAGELKNHRQLNVLKKDIARILTILNERSE